MDTDIEVLERMIESRCWATQEEQAALKSAIAALSHTAGQEAEKEGDRLNFRRQMADAEHYQREFAATTRRIIDEQNAAPAQAPINPAEIDRKLVGGEAVACPECRAAVLFECIACSANNYPSNKPARTLWDAAKRVNNLYPLHWDRVDGAAVVMPERIEEFEDAFSDLDQALAQPPASAEVGREDAR